VADENGSVLVSPVSGQESHMIVRAGRAGALAWVEAGEGELPAGSSIRFLEL
jgi:molybdopterin biosynthesis enzyme